MCNSWYFLSYIYILCDK